MNALQDHDVRSYELDINVSEDIFRGINKRLLNDFENFKRTTKLEHCILNQEKPKGNTIRVKWTAVKHYKQRLVDVDRLQRDLALLNVDGDQATIGDMSINENGCMVEFEILRDYIVNVVE